MTAATATTATTTTTTRPAQFSSPLAAMSAAKMTKSMPVLTAFSKKSSWSDEAERRRSQPLPDLPLSETDEASHTGHTGHTGQASLMDPDHMADLLPSSPSSTTPHSKRRTSSLASMPPTPGTPQSLLSERATGCTGATGATGATASGRRGSLKDAGETISVHRLRSNSGLALHTNTALLRRYTDYNADGSSRIPAPDQQQLHQQQQQQQQQQMEQTSQTNQTSKAASAKTAVGSASPDSRSARSSSPPTTPDTPSPFSRETVLAVLQDPVARDRLWQFARNQDCQNSLDFLQMVDDYNKAVHGVVALMATISTKFTCVAATDSLHLPQPLAKSLNADIVRFSRSVLPGLEMLFGEAAAHIEDRIVRDIYPAFIQHQISVRMKASLGAVSAMTAQSPFRFSGLGHAFCLTDPSRPEHPVMYASDSFAHIIGFPAAEDVPRSGRCLGGLQTDALRSRDGDADGAATSSQDIVLSRRQWDKQPFWSHVSICPLQTSRNRIRLSLVGLVDISDAVKTEEDIIHALKCDPAIPAPLTDSDAKRTVTFARPKSQHRLSGSAATQPGNADTVKPLHTSPTGNKSFLRPFSRRQHSIGNWSDFVKGRPLSSASNVGQQQSQPQSQPQQQPLRAATPTIAELQPTKHDSALSTPQPPPLGDAVPYSQFMLLQFVSGSTTTYDMRAPPPPPISRYGNRYIHPGSTLAMPTQASLDASRLKVAYCSRPLLELLGLDPANQDAVLYHDIFAVLTELAGSPSIGPVFQAAVRQRMATSEPTSLQLSIPASGTPPGVFSAGLGVGMASPSNSPAAEHGTTAEGNTRRPSLFSRIRSKRLQTNERPASLMVERKTHDPKKMRQLMSHWTPLKDAEGSIAWVILIISPVPST